MNHDYIHNKHCIDCGIIISDKAIRCNPCKGLKRRIIKKKCKLCEVIIENRNKSGFCRFCFLKYNNPQIYNKPHKNLCSCSCCKAIRGELHGNRDKYNNIYFRSSWEVLFAKFLDKNNIKWLYEQKKFDLVDTIYLPDFYLPATNEYIEIKGYWRDDARIKFNLFKIFYPQEKIQILQKEDLQQLEIL